MKEIISWFLKGAAMGVADGVPGVSGGTIALITGIYERFVAAIAAFKPSLWRYIQQKDFKGLWLAIDGRFLLSLGAGILLSLFSTLSVMHWLLENVAPVVWAFFMGVIVVSLWFMCVGKKWQLNDFMLLISGMIIALGLIFSTPTELEATPFMLILGGAIAISAMILPGISGSFMLLLLGLYPVVVEAVHARDVVVVLWVALGCLIGILSFSQILQWLLKRWHDRVMSFMLGFVVGALVKVWPWQIEEGQLWLSPSQYTDTTGLPSYLMLSLISFLVGSVLVWLLTTRSRS
jgi:putative membrane protein